MRALSRHHPAGCRLYIWLLIAAAVLSLADRLQRGQYAQPGRRAWSATSSTASPSRLLRPIRNMLPDLGGIDISPVILILIIILIENVIALLHLPERLLIGSERGRGRCVPTAWRLTCG